MAYITYGPYSHGLYSYGRYSYGLYSYGPYSYGLYSYGLYSYGLYSYGHIVMAYIVMALQRPDALPHEHLRIYGLYSYGPPASTYTDLARRRRRRRRLTGRADGLLCARARRVAVAGCVALLEPFDLELQRRHVRLELPTTTVQAITIQGHI